MNGIEPHSVAIGVLIGFAIIVSMVFMFLICTMP